MESFNHQLLSYLPKRIHFSDEVFGMRMSLALMDWLSVHRHVSKQTCFRSLQQNENVNQPYTSQAKVQDLRRPERRTAMTVLVNKSFTFVDMLWAMYVTHNSVDFRFAHTIQNL